MAPQNAINLSKYKVNNSRCGWKPFREWSSYLDEPVVTVFSPSMLISQRMVSVSLGNRFSVGCFNSVCETNLKDGFFCELDDGDYGESVLWELGKCVQRFGSGSNRIHCIWPDPDPLKKALIWIRVAPKLFRIKSKTKCFCYLRNAFSKFWR